MNNLIRTVLQTALVLICTNLVVSGETPNVQYPNGVAAVVDNHIITLEDLQRKLSPFIGHLQRECTTASQFQERLAPLANEVLERMIDDRLLINSFMSDKKLRVPESYLENHYTKFLVENFQGNRSNYLEFLAAEGKTDREIREQQKEDVILGFLRGKMKRPESAVSPAQIQKYYDDNQSQFSQKETIHLRQIVFKNESDAASDSTVLPEKTQEIIELLKNGQPFAELAKKFTEDGLGNSGGDLGWVDRSAIRPELAKIAFSLNKNQFSEPIILNGHTFILLVEDKKPGGQIPLQSISDKIEKTLSNEYSKQFEAQYVQKLRKKAHIKYYL